MDEVLQLESYFASDSFEVHTDVGEHVGADGNLEKNDWIVLIPGSLERVCDEYSLI